MNELVKHSLIWGAVVASVLCSLIWAIAWRSIETRRAAMGAGLVQKPFTTTVQTQSDTGWYWAKPDLEHKK